jgi:hypothetical protein
MEDTNLVLNAMHVLVAIVMFVAASPVALLALFAEAEGTSLSGAVTLFIDEWVVSSNPAFPLVCLLHMPVYIIALHLAALCQ